MVTNISNIINNCLKKKKHFFLIVIILLLITFSTQLKTPNIITFIPKFQITKSNKDNSIGTIIIKKIKLTEKLYPINSEENNVEKHVTILKESIFPPKHDSIIFLAGHSGTGNIAYFERLNELQEKDEIILIYKNKKYKYQVKNSWEERKKGYININKDKENQLILTTCSPTNKNYQLIVNCIKKESN